MQTGSREFDLLCACAAVEISPQRAARIAAATGAGLDWNRFLQLAEHHGVLPLVARTLDQHRAGVPSDIRESLEQANEQNIRRNLWFGSELTRILEHFEKKKLRAIPYKGPVLAESVYGDLALRSFNDLDFLIHPADFRTAQQVITELGYCPSEEWSASVERYWLKKGYERAFDGKAGKYLVELQWALLPYFFAVDLRTDDLLERSGESLLNDRKTHSLSAEDSLLVLCLHAAKHLWMRLIWICDIAESIRTQTIDYSLLAARARQAGVLRIVGISFWLVDNVLGAHLARAAQDVADSDNEVPVLGQTFAGRLARGAAYNFESTEYFLLIRKLRERYFDRWRYLWRLVWTPGVGDLASIRFPEPLFPFYHAVRLGRLAGKLIFRAR